MKYLLVFIVISFSINVVLAGQDSSDQSKYTFFDQNLRKLWGSYKDNINSTDRTSIACSISGLIRNININLPALRPESRQWVIEQLQKEGTYSIQELENSQEYYIYLLDVNFSRLLNISDSLCFTNFSQDKKTEILYWLDLALILNEADISLSLRELSKRGVINNEIWGGTSYPELFFNFMKEGILTKFVKVYIQNDSKL
ncbi:TPA: hypothetical protein ACU0X8_002341 [Legionella anisa]